MVRLPARYRALRGLWARGQTAFYGRALRLPPAATAYRPLPPDHALVEGLRPFRSRLHRQRATVALLRMLILAVCAALAVLLLRAFGFAVPLPQAPLLAAGIVAFLGLLVPLWLRPSAAQMAQALDRCLNLHEQIGSALDLVADGDDSRLGQMLCRRAETTLRTVYPELVLPWPSLQRERRTLTTLAASAAIVAFIAIHAPLRHTGPVSLTAQGGPRGTALQHHAALATKNAQVKLLALGTGTHPWQALPSSPRWNGAGTRSATHPGTASGKGSGAAHLMPGQPGSSQSGQQGQGSNGLAGGKQGTTAGRGTAGNGRSASQGRTIKLHLSSGKNSTAGGVGNPQQQALQNLQNSIAQTQQALGQQGRQGASPNSRNGTNGSSKNGGANGKHNGQRTGQGAGNGQGQHGQRAGQQGGSSGQNGQSSGVGRNGQGTGQGLRGPSTGYDPRLGGQRDASGGDQYMRNGRFGQPGAGTGTDSGAVAQHQSDSSLQARLSDSSITLLGVPGAGRNGQLTVTMGPPSRIAGAGSALPGASGRPTVSIPGYVAPDSNAIDGDARSVVQGYFTPSSNNQ